jgi:hypothetical protein
MPREERGGEGKEGLSRIGKACVLRTIYLGGRDHYYEGLDDSITSKLSHETLKVELACR